MKQKQSHLVYSTDQGRITVKEGTAASQFSREPSDGIIRIRRETKGRKGKGVTTVSGFDLNEAELKTLLKSLKQSCATGGAIKQGIIEIQGDHREKLKQTLEKLGHTVKLAEG